MNRINPDKLLHSKWTALQVKQKERHFIVSRLQRADDETILSCELEAIINNNVYEIDWQQLKYSSLWLGKSMGERSGEGEHRVPYFNTRST